MNHFTTRQTQVHPEETSNLLSNVTFFYTLKLFKVGLCQDIYEVPSTLKSETVVNNLLAKWKKSKISILKILIKCYGLHYLILGLIQMIAEMSLLIILPYATGKLIAYFAPNQRHLSKDDAYLYTGVIIGTKFLNCLCMNKIFLMVAKLGIKIRTVIYCIIYKKILSLNQQSSSIPVGRVLTLITRDILALINFLEFGNDPWIIVFKFVLVVILLYRKIGIAALLGMTTLLISLPLQIYVLMKIPVFRTKMCARSDERYQFTQEVLSAIRIIKMYTWEKFYERKISKSRKKEVKNIQKLWFCRMVAVSCSLLNIPIVLYTTLRIFIKLGNEVTAEKAFFVITSCIMLEHNMYRFIKSLSLTVYLIPCFRRLQSFLNADEIVPRENNVVESSKIVLRGVVLKIKNRRIFDNIAVDITQKGLVLLRGPIGKGKTSFLKLIMGELLPQEGQLDVEGTISYASQDPWIFPSTIKQNILFGQTYNGKRYYQVLKACSLIQDLELMADGDATIVEDRAINLSKGQQIRINLARTIYRDCQIYLLDDCLSSLDISVKRFVFTECIQEFLKDKLVILVTNDNILCKHVDYSFICNKKSLQIETSLSKIDDACTTIDQKGIITKPTENGREETEDDETCKLIKSSHQEIYKEINECGAISPQVFLKYIQSGGGFTIVFLIGMAFGVSQFVSSYIFKLISNWIDMELSNSTAEVISETRQNFFYLYSFMLSLKGATLFSRILLLLIFVRKSSMSLHKKTFKRVIKATMEFFDENFIGSILNRLSKDFVIIDEQLPLTILLFFIYTSISLGTMALIVIVNKMFLILVAAYVSIVLVLSRFYLKTSRNLRRSEAALRSPVIGYINATMEGLPTIRASKVQNILTEEFYNHLDRFTSVSYTVKCCEFGFMFVLDLISLCFVFGIIAKFLISSPDKAGNVGLAISQSMILLTMLQKAIFEFVAIENHMTSVERVLQYSKIKLEREQGSVEEKWPLEGKISYENVDFSYHDCNVPTLKGINFTIEPGDKIAVVGRTGAGKSSIIYTLFRLYDIHTGRITIDDVDINQFPLSFLRSRISLMPQDGIIFTGSIRENIDPLGKSTDQEIWSNLESLNLRDIISSLDMKFETSNFSVGQRQLISLARALICKNKIVVLDEATANVDPETETLIYDVLEKNFKDSTVIIITHKLHHVGKCDKVMVLDNGEVKVFGNVTDSLEGDIDGV